LIFIQPAKRSSGMIFQRLNWPRPASADRAPKPSSKCLHYADTRNGLPAGHIGRCAAGSQAIQSKRPALLGLPVALKDLFDTVDILTSAGSSSFAGNIPAEDAQAVLKIRLAGAVIVGKTNLHEIALGVTNINPIFGACHNPWNTACISGGSSGGSAVSVATGMSLEH